FSSSMIMLIKSVYLVTYLCDADDAGATSDAEVCIRRNRAETSASSPESRKIIWSRTYGDKTLTSGVAQTIGWNLSCPNKGGWGAASVTCEASGSNAAEPEKTGSTNSNVAYNKEAVHAYRAAIEPIKTYGTMKPSASNTIRRLCTANKCQDEINFYLAG